MNISLTDPAARWTAAPGGPAFYAYSTNYLIDVHAGVIVDVEATAAHRTEETDATKTMLDRVEERFDLKPQRLIGDTAYVTGKYAAIFPAMRKAGRVAPGHGTGARHGAEETSTAERARVA
jgi:hypothetical protein